MESSSGSVFNDPPHDMISELIERAIHSNVGYRDHIAPIGPIGGGGVGRHPILVAR